MLRYLAVFSLLAWAIFEGVGYANNPARRNGFPPPGHDDVKHTEDQLTSIGLIKGMSRADAEARIAALGFKECWRADDHHVTSCIWRYREFLNPSPISWILEVQFENDQVSDIASLTGYYSGEY